MVDAFDKVNDTVPYVCRIKEEEEEAESCSEHWIWNKIKAALGLTPKRVSVHVCSRQPYSYGLK